MTKKHTAQCNELGRGVSCYCEDRISLAVVGESATHIAFVNGETYGRKEILRAVKSYGDMLWALKQFQELYQSGKPIRPGAMLCVDTDRIIADAEKTA